MRIQAVLNIIYPPQCLICPTRTVEQFALCGACLRDVPFVTGLTCAQCAAALPGTSERSELCDRCRSAPPPWAAAWASLWYNGRTPNLILPLKHGDRTDLARPLGGWMAHTMRRAAPPGALVVPVPLHWTRRVKRRYNQSALLVAEICRQTGMEYRMNALVRTRRTVSLNRRGRAEREAILDGCITATGDFAGRDVVLVDDVMTTGATLRESTRAALGAGAGKVFVAVLARAGNSG